MKKTITMLAVSAMLFASCKNETEKEILKEQEKATSEVAQLFPGTDALRCAPGIPMSVLISNYSTSRLWAQDSAVLNMYVKVTASRDPVTVPSVAKIAWGNNSEDRPVITDTNSSVLWVAIRNNIGQYVDGQLSGGYLAEGAADASITPMDTNSQLVEGEYNIAPNTSAIFRIAGKIRELPYDKYAVQFTYDMLLQLIVGKSRNQPVRIWLRDRPNFVSKPVPAPGFKED